MQVMEQVRQNRKILACQDNLEPFQRLTGWSLLQSIFIWLKILG